MKNGKCRSISTPAMRAAEACVKRASRQSASAKASARQAVSDRELVGMSLKVFADCFEEGDWASAEHAAKTLVLLCRVKRDVQLVRTNLGEWGIAVEGRGDWGKG